MSFPVRKIPEAAAWYACGLLRRALTALRFREIDVPRDADSMAQYERRP